MMISKRISKQACSSFPNRFIRNNQVSTSTLSLNIKLNTSNKIQPNLSSAINKQYLHHQQLSCSRGIITTINKHASTKSSSISPSFPIWGTTRRSIFIDTESTPNPQSMKFKPGREVLPEGFGTGMYFQQGHREGGSDNVRSPLSLSLFTIRGVKGVFLGKDFITVTKQPDDSWMALKPQIFSKILDFFAEGKAVVEEKPLQSDTTVLDTDDEIVATIKELMETRIRPAVQEDGGDIFFRGFNEDTGIVKVQLAGSCVGCPSSSVTLRNGVENMLMHYVPEVKGIEDVPAEGEEQEIALSPTPTTSAAEFRKEDVSQ